LSAVVSEAASLARRPRAFIASPKAVVTVLALVRLFRWHTEQGGIRFNVKAALMPSGNPGLAPVSALHNSTAGKTRTMALMGLP
jgi:hypothetical protein